MAVTTYLDRFLEPMTEALTPEVARVIADLRVDPDQCVYQHRAGELIVRRQNKAHRMQCN